MNEKILIYLCMNAIFSETMQDTETQISQFILEGMSKFTLWSKIVNTIFGSCFIYN